MEYPKITPAGIEANIQSIEIIKHISKSGQVLRWAIINTPCGFSVVGDPSCAVSSENDNQAKGEEVAIANSKERMWPLMGYALKVKLAEGKQG